MSLIKSLIQRLLDSRTTPSEAGHNAMPSSAPTTISSPTSITSWGTIATFTAPGDGYVTFHGRSMNSASAQIASLPLDNNPTVITATQDNYQGMACNLPVQKGKTVEIYGSNIENIVISFNRLIGGGCNRIVRRALSCLKPSFNYSLRNFLRISLSGSAVRHTLQGGLRSRPASPNMSLQRTATWGSTNLIRARITASMFTHSGQTVTSSQEKLLDSLLVPRTSLSQVLFPLRKAITLLSAVPSQSFGSHQQWGVNTNLQTGGALC